jgi:hypothetical protein
MARLKEAASRTGWVSVNVWFPPDMHKALAQLRVDKGVAAGEAIRRAVRAWLARHGRKGGRP